MIESEKQEIRAKLIELGFWGADEPGDPTTDRHAAVELRNRIARQIAPGFSVSFGFADRQLTKYVVQIVGQGIDHPFTPDHDRFIAICRAALELPEFFTQRPECAGGKTDEFPSELDTE
jgi:hypothetical protein